MPLCVCGYTARWTETVTPEAELPQFPMHRETYSGSSYTGFHIYKTDPKCNNTLKRYENKRRTTGAAKCVSRP